MCETQERRIVVPVIHPQIVAPSLPPCLPPSHAAEAKKVWVFSVVIMNVVKEVVACVLLCVNEESKASNGAVFIGGRDQRFVRPQLFLLQGYAKQVTSILAA